MLTAAALGPLLARAAVRLATRDPAARAGAARALASAAVLAVLLCGAVLLTGTYPAAAVCDAALLVDAVLLGTWPDLLRALLAAAAAGGVSLLAALAAPSGLGLGDVKLLALLGLLLGWAGWGVLLAGVFLGLLAGAAGSLLLVVAGRAGWRTAVPFGPPLLLGAVLALLLAGPLG